jgi:hypothetical protein
MKHLAALALMACSLWLLRAQVRAWPVRAEEARPAPAAAPPAARTGQAAPKAARTTEALGARPGGNTDNGLIPWNGGDLYMRDYSGLTHPNDGAPR